MFDSIRNHSKILMGLLFLLVIPSFVLFGIEGYTQFEDKGAVVAKVNGQKNHPVRMGCCSQRRS
jgi:peptidyl-prolyl cis-trans isomerase D